MEGEGKIVVRNRTNYFIALAAGVLFVVIGIYSIGKVAFVSSIGFNTEGLQLLVFGVFSVLAGGAVIIFMPRSAATFLPGARQLIIRQKRLFGSSQEKSYDFSKIAKVSLPRRQTRNSDGRKGTYFPLILTTSDGEEIDLDFGASSSSSAWIAGPSARRKKLASQIADVTGAKLEIE